MAIVGGVSSRKTANCEKLVTSAQIGGGVTGRTGLSIQACRGDAVPSVEVARTSCAVWFIVTLPPGGMVPKRQPYSPWCGSPTICCPQNVVFGELMAENLVPAGSGSKSVAWSEDEGPLFVSVVVKL